MSSRSAADSDTGSLLELVVSAISPALIMAMVGSLAFFLLDLAYQGQFTGRLQWTLFFFVFATVLIARVSILLSPTQAAVYGSALGAVTFLAMLKFVEFERGTTLAAVGWLINLAVMGLIWWAAHKLTWDCTYIDESQSDTGRGLLTEAGLGPLTSEVPKEKTRAPGVWVLWFSLAALPIFGLGQSLIPATDVSRRRYSFILMTIYVGSGLGLLATTTLLGLRRYLRQRNLRMPMAMTGRWLAVAGVLTLVLLFAGAILPRPQPEYPLFAYRPLGSPDRPANRAAPPTDEAGKGDGAAGAESKDKTQSETDKPGDRGRAGGDKPGRSSSNDKADEKSAGGRNSTGGRDGSPKDGDGQSGEESKSGSGESTASGSQPTSALEQAGAALKWVAIIILILFTLAVVAVFLLRHLARFSDRFREMWESFVGWWQGLFGGAKAEEPVDVEPPPPQRRAHFSDFADPFADGSANRQTPTGLVRYSFAALEAWAGDRRLGRANEETPLEFARRLTDEVPTLDPEARRLATLFARAAYSGQPLPATSRDQVAGFWRVLGGVQGTGF